MATPIKAFCDAFKQHAPAFRLEDLSDRAAKFAEYYELLLQWNPRLHLVAPCSPEEFAVRHVLESLLLLKHLPARSAVVDVGSGAGLPIIPCLLARDDLRATLIESSKKKAVFLNEALRAIASPKRASVTAVRFEETSSPPADLVTCRALDCFAEKLSKLIEWAPPAARFAFFVGEDLRRQAASLLSAVEVEQIPLSDQRFLLIGTR